MTMTSSRQYYAAFIGYHYDDESLSSTSAVIACKRVNGVALTYLLELSVPVENVCGRPRLRSASTRCISLHRVQTSTGQRSFAHSGPAVWNNLSRQPCANFIGFTYFLLLSIPSLSIRIVPLRFQAGGRRRRPNLVLVCVCVICIP